MKKRVKVPTVLQMEMTECGAASLAMVLAYYGCYIPLEQMRVETGVSRDGCNARNILRAAKAHGLNCRAFRKEPDALRKLPMPCIIHWNLNHFVVLEGFRGRSVYINDPAHGRRKLSFSEFDECFTGIVLTFEKTKEFVRQKKQGHTSAFIRKRLKGYWPVLMHLVYIGLLLIFPGLVLPTLSRIFVDDILGSGYTNWFTRLMVFMAACLLLKSGLTFYRSAILAKLQSKMSLLSGYHFLAHMFRLPIHFFDQRSPGDLAFRVENNDEVNTFLAGDLAETVLSIFTAAFYLVILLLFSPQLTLIGLACLSAGIVVSLIANKWVANAMMKLQMSNGKLYGAVCSGLSITDTIKAAGAENEYSNRLIGHQALNATQVQKMKRFQQIISAIPQALDSLSGVLILMTGALLVIRGHFTVGMLVAFTSLFDSFSEPITKLISFFENLQTLKSNIMRIDDVQRHPEDPFLQKAQQSDRIEKKLDGAIELQDVTFGYSQLNDPIVKGIHFSLPCGQSVAFVGPSGCGKSTISKVISGLYQPWSGQVLLDGKPMAQIPTRVLNASVATVSQNITLFSGTVKDNLTLWNDAIREEDMIAAAKDACIHDFIMTLPGGYDYVLTENAANLSGGQRQRMEIARALTGNPRILIMDEATSALDPLVEKQIMDNIRRRGCTCLIVAHRLSTIRDCNQILVMENGNIVQQGTHLSLMQQEGLYRKLLSNL